MAAGTEFIVASGEYQLQYRVNSDNTTVSCYGATNTTATSDLVIPSTVTHNGTTYTVTHIADRAFENDWDNPKYDYDGGLILPNTLVELGEMAFYQTTLEGDGILTIPSSVTTLGGSCFCYNKFTILNINGPLASVGPYAFGVSLVLETVNFTEGITVLGDSMFGACTELKNCGKLNGLQIPDSVIEIQGGAFERTAQNFKGDLIIPDNVTTIGMGTFAGMLEYPAGFDGNLIIGNSVEIISYLAFRACVKIKKCISKNPTPPTLASDVFPDFTQSETVVLEVPKGTVNAYVAAGWDDYFNIEEIPTAEIRQLKDQDENKKETVIYPVTKSEAVYHNDKKLSEVLEDIGVLQVQSDWEETDSTSKAFIKNKPNTVIGKTELPLEFVAMQPPSTITETDLVGSGKPFSSVEDFYNFMLESISNGCVVKMGGAVNIDCQLLNSGNTVESDYVTHEYTILFSNTYMSIWEVTITLYNDDVTPNTINVTFNIKAMMPESPNWTETDTNSVTYIRNKPNVPELDSNNLIPTDYLPSYVDDVIEVANFENLPTPGETSKIYVTLDNNKTYRWGGTEYVEISASLVIGTTEGTAAAGNHTHTNFTRSKSGMVPVAPTEAGTTKYLREDGTWQIPPDNNTTYDLVTDTTDGLMSVIDKINLQNLLDFYNGVAMRLTYQNTEAFKPTIKVSGATRVDWGDGQLTQVASGITSITPANNITNLDEKELVIYGRDIELMDSTTTECFLGPNKDWRKYMSKVKLISINTIGARTFLACSTLTGNLIIPNSVTTIGENAFASCLGFIGNLIIPNSVTTIGDGAFMSCKGFTGDLIIPNSVTIINGMVFRNCTGFNGNLVIPNSVTDIDAFVFTGCTGFTGNLVIPNSVITIGKAAFGGCVGFNGNLVIPDSVTTIVYEAFGGCDSINIIDLSTVTDVPTLEGDGVFPLKPIHVPQNLLEDFKTATNWSEYANLMVGV